MIWRDILRAHSQRLIAAGIDGAERDVMKLALHVTGRAWLDVMEEPQSDDVERLEICVRRRIQREPVSHILGYRDFWESRFTVNSHVLDPRPDTETLIAKALDIMPQNACIVDIGCGSGAIGLSLARARPDISVVLTDISADAITVAQENAHSLGVAQRCEFLRGAWYEPLAGRRFDMLLSNPPYLSAHEMNEISPELRYEPGIALSPGGDGLDAYRALAGNLADHMKQDGCALWEIGAQQGVAVSSIVEFEKAFTYEILKDIDDRDRVIHIYSL